MLTLNTSYQRKETSKLRKSRLAAVGRCTVGRVTAGYQCYAGHHQQQHQRTSNQLIHRRFTKRAVLPQCGENTRPGQATCRPLTLMKAQMKNLNENCKTCKSLQQSPNPLLLCGLQQQKDSYSTNFPEMSVPWQQGWLRGTPL